MAQQNVGVAEAVAGCPKIAGFNNAASHAQLIEGLIPDCVVAVTGENFGTESASFDPPVNEAFGIYLSFSTGDRFSIYSITPKEIVCVIPGTIAAPQPFILELHAPQQGPVPCPTVVLKGRTATTAPGLFTKDGTAHGRGLFYTYPDGYEQPLPPGDNLQPTMVQVYGTGLRHARRLPEAFMDGAALTVTACEADTTRPGYDRLIFLLLAPGLAPGLHRFKVAADGKTSNEVEVEVK
jgi:hypothetical protein